jgi:dihydroceramidase
MTGTGAYFYFVWAIWLRHYLNYRQNEYELVWPNIWTAPEVVKSRSAGNGYANGNGHTNGYTNGYSYGSAKKRNASP